MSIEQMLSGVSPDEEQRVNAIVKQYGVRVRDAVKDAAALSYVRRGHAQHRVAVHVVSGGPDAVVQTFLDDDLGSSLAAYRDAFVRAAACLDLLPQMPGGLGENAAMAFRQLCPLDASQEASGFLRDMVRRIDQAGVVQRILVNTMDPLGTNTPRERQGTITLYWQMIALVAPNIGTSTEALTLKVLAHEYAHSLSHLGMDADGLSWDLDGYWGADDHVHEGLANYWSWSAMNLSNDWLMKEASRALSAMWPRQSPPYAEFNVWLSKGVKPEDVRAAVRNARTRSRVGADDFRQMLGLSICPG